MTETAETTIPTTARNATLSDLADLLQTQQTRKLDVVAPASAIRAQNGAIVIEGTDAMIDDDGVTPTDGVYRPTGIFDEGIADKLGIPVSYVRRMREERPDLYDANVNGWLRGYIMGHVGRDNTRYEPSDPDPRSFLVRTFRGDDGGAGIARAFLSDSYKRMDNLDVLMATLEGIREAGVEVDIEACDLTERNMYVRVVAPEITALAPVLLDGYRSPFDEASPDRKAAAARHGWYTDGDEPIVFAGFVLRNSETGGGAFSLAPRIVIRRCRNGLTFTGDALREVHLGSKLEEGVIRWSGDTQQANLDLITSMAADAVGTFLDVEYVQRKVAEVEAKAGAQIDEPQKAVEVVAQRCRFTKAQSEGILSHFIRGGDTSAGGVMNAVTSYAQTVDDPDTAFDMESSALTALDAAAAFAS